MNGKFENRIQWEAPAKVYHSTNLDAMEIGAYSYIAPYSEVVHTSIGRYCSIGPYAHLFGSAHPMRWLSTHPFTHTNAFKSFVDYEPTLTFPGYEGTTMIGHDVWMGANVIVKHGLRIGNGAVIGAGAVVTKDVPDYAVVAGNPARILKYRFEDALIERLQRVQWWRFDMPRLMADHPDLPFDRPEAMLDLIEEREETLPKIASPRKVMVREGNGLRITTLPLAEPETDRSVLRP